MPEQLRPDPAHPASSMATKQGIAGQYLDTLAGRIDELVAATARADWDQVQRVCRELADGGRVHGCRAITAAAEHVCDEVNRPCNVLGIKRSLIRMIGTCGRIGLPRQAYVSVAD